MANFQRPPPDPEGHGPDAVWHRQNQKFNKKNVIKSVTGGKLIPDGSGGFHLVIPKPKPQKNTTTTLPPTELDPRVAVKAGSHWYVSPQAALATTGLKDLVTGTNPLLAPAGGWWAVKDVPAQVTIAGIVCYNVPQLPPQLGVPSGTPLKGDLDGANCFWVPDWIYNNC